MTPTKYGTRVHIRIDGALYQKHFPIDAERSDMRQWLVDTEIAHRKGPVLAGSFDYDAARYLQLVTSMTSYSDRKRDILAWVGKFTGRARSTITSTEIAAALQAWRQTLSASSCNSRRAALQHLFTRLDGKGAKNPVRDVPKFPLPALAPRGYDYRDVRKILKAIPRSPEKAILSMVAYTGLPPSIIYALTEDSFIPPHDLSVPGRKKGTGTQGRVVPLTPQGVRAFKMMIATKAFAGVPRFRLRRVFRQACVDAGVPVGRPYDLRHSFGTEVYRKSGDPEAVQVLMLHASSAMTRRYTLAAVPARARKALKGFGR